jgi:hypothetical protein
MVRAGSRPATRRSRRWIAAEVDEARSPRPRQHLPRWVRRGTAIVSRDTGDADFAQNRQRFLAEQGYAYRIVDAEDLKA